MKITAIKQQVKRAERYSIFVDDKYAFSLSEGALLSSGLASGQELTAQQLADYKQQSADDKIFAMALRWASFRPRGVWETKTYLGRKDCPTALAEQITNKLVDLGLVGDELYARAFVSDRTRLRPAPRRKIIAELKAKHIPEEVIQITLDEQGHDEADALQAVIAKARRQSKYAHDDQKLMAYLARQGFNYSDIKDALAQSDA